MCVCVYMYTPVMRISIVLTLGERMEQLHLELS